KAPQMPSRDERPFQHLPVTAAWPDASNHDYSPHRPSRLHDACRMVARRQEAPRMRTFLAIILAMAGCNSSSDTAADAAGPDLEPPPRVCRTPTGPHAMPWFEDATADYGLDAGGAIKPHGNSVYSGDFDNDGWSDLIIVAGSSQRGPGTSAPLVGAQL